MLLRFVILHATVLLVVGFFVGFAAQKASGGLATFGRLLSYWLYFLVVAGIVLAIVRPGFIMGPRAGMMEQLGQPAAPSQPTQQ